MFKRLGVLEQNTRLSELFTRFLIGLCLGWHMVLYACAYKGERETTRYKRILSLSPAKADSGLKFGVGSGSRASGLSGYDRCGSGTNWRGSGFGCSSSEPFPAFWGWGCFLNPEP